MRDGIRMVIIGFGVGGYSGPAGPGSDGRERVVAYSPVSDFFGPERCFVINLP